MLLSYIIKRALKGLWKVPGTAELEISRIGNEPCVLCGYFVVTSWAFGYFREGIKEEKSPTLHQMEFLYFLIPKIKP